MNAQELLKHLSAYAAEYRSAAAISTSHSCNASSQYETGKADGFTLAAAWLREAIDRGDIA